MEQWEKMPIYQKAMEIMAVVNSLIESVLNTDIKFEHPVESELIKHNLKYMGINASTISAKIAGASHEDIPYDIKMENATLIRKAARELIVDALDLEKHGNQDTEYLDLLRKELDEFRILFAEWVKTFDCWSYSIDRWGLFNPPGIQYDDNDPDDDLPFNNPLGDDDQT
jgi:hypothetical protein